MTISVIGVLNRTACAVTLALSLVATASAAPLMPASPLPAGEQRPAASPETPLTVQHRGGGSRGGGWNRGGDYRGGSWNRGGNRGGNWNRGGKWNHGRYWNRGRHWHGGGWGGYGGYWGGSGIVLGWGIPAYRWADPYYDRYYLPPAPVYRARRVGDAHVRWCYERYRSYRAWDNTFQPYHGPRRACVSPFG